MFDISAARERELQRWSRPVLVAIAGTGPARRRARRSALIGVFVIVFVAGNALLARDLFVTRANAARLPQTEAAAHAQIDERRADLAATQERVTVARTDLGRVTQTRDTVKRSTTAARDTTTRRQAEIKTTDAKATSLKQRATVSVECLGKRQGALNAATFNDGRHERQAMNAVGNNCETAR